MPLLKPALHDPVALCQSTVRPMILVLNKIHASLILNKQSLVIKGLTKSKTTKSIAERINRYVVTEICDSNKIFAKTSLYKEQTST